MPLAPVTAQRAQALVAPSPPAEAPADLPVRYREMPAGELVSESTARTWSLVGAGVALAAFGTLAWLAVSTERREGPARRAEIARNRAALGRANPRRRRRSRR